MKTVGTPQSLAGDQSTSVYSNEVVWIKGGSKSKWTFKSSEIPNEVVQEILPNMDAQKQAAIRKSHKNYFNAAHEIHKLCQRVVRESME